MKKIIVLVMLLMAFLISTNHANAQFDKLKDKAEQVKNRIDESTKTKENKTDKKTMNGNSNSTENNASELTENGLKRIPQFKYDEDGYPLESDAPSNVMRVRSSIDELEKVLPSNDKSQIYRLHEEAEYTLNYAKTNHSNYDYTEFDKRFVEATKKVKDLAGPEEYLEEARRFFNQNGSFGLGNPDDFLIGNTAEIYFYNQMVGRDWQKIKKYSKSLGPNNFDASYFISLEKEINEYYTNTMYAFLNNLIDDIYNTAKTDLPQAANKTKAGKFLVDGLVAFGGLDNIETLQADIQRMYEKYVKAAEDAIYLTQYHRDNPKTLVFSNVSIDNKEEDLPSKLKEDFSADDDYIYGLGLFDNPIKDISGEIVQMNVYINGVQKIVTNVKIGKDDMESTDLGLHIMPKPSKIPSAEANEFLEAFIKLSPRTHKVKVELRHPYAASHSAPLASGEFSLQVTESGIAKMESTLQEYKDLAVEDVRLPKPVVNNSSLQADLERVAKEAYPTFKKLITSSDWSIKRHELTGVITHKIIFAFVVYKKDDGTCWVNEISFSKDYENGNYGKIYRSGTGFTNYQIGCSNINK